MKLFLLHLLLVSFVVSGSIAANTISLQPLWNLLPGDREYLGTGNTERGMDYNPVTGNIYVVSLTDALDGPVRAVAILDGAKGDHVGELDLTGISGGTFHLNMIGVAEDGAIYACNLAAGATLPFQLYRWANEQAAPVLVYSDDPGFEPNRRWGDNLAVRGSGESTEILILSHAFALNSLATILRPTDASMMSFSATWIDQTIASMGLGSAFASGDVFWATRATVPLLEVSFDLAVGTGTLLRSFGMVNSTVVDEALVGMGPLAVNLDKGLLAGLRGYGDVYLFDIETLQEGVENTPLHVRALPTSNSSSGGGIGDLAWAGDRLYILSTNNGVAAYELSELSDVEVWRMTHFGTIENVGDAANDASPAGDGIPNLVKFALGLDPHVPGRDGLPTTAVEDFDLPRPVWQILPGERNYITTGSLQRGMAYSAVTGNLYVVNRSGGLSVAIVEGATGEHAGFLDVAGISGGTFDLNMVGVAEDGAIYACNLTTNAAGTPGPFRLYRWADENDVPVQVFTGDPGFEPGRRWGDNIAVRGAGDSTQVLIASQDSYATLLRPVQGSMESFTATWLGSETFPPMWNGTTFGAGNTFFGTLNGQPLHEIGFDPDAGSATLLRVIGGQTVDERLWAFTLISADIDKKLIAGVRRLTGEVYLYDLETLEEGVEHTPLDTQVLAGTGTIALGNVAFAEDRLYVMQSNRSLTAFPLLQTDEGSYKLTEGESFLTFSFTRVNPPPSGIEYVVEISEDLINWSQEGAVFVSETILLEEGLAVLLYRSAEAIGAEGLGFMRLRIVLQ